MGNFNDVFKLLMTILRGLCFSSQKVAGLVQYNGYTDLSEDEPIDLPSCVYASRGMLSSANCSHLPAYLSLAAQGIHSSQLQRTKQRVNKYLPTVVYVDHLGPGKDLFVSPPQAVTESFFGLARHWKYHIGEQGIQGCSLKLFSFISRKIKCWVWPPYYEWG